MSTFHDDNDQSAAEPSRQPHDEDVPAPLRTLNEALNDHDRMSRLMPLRKPVGGAASAVLILLSDDPDPTVLYTERASAMRQHGGQISFPGGRSEPSDASPADTALREAREEVGLDASKVHLLGALPISSLPVSSFDVTPVVGWWHDDDSLRVASTNEVASVQHWPISLLADPQVRVSAIHPGRSLGPAWQLDSLFLWGFTAYLTQALLMLGGWEQPWDDSRHVEVPKRFRSDYRPDAR